MGYKLIIFDIDGTITRHISSWRYIHEKLGIWEKKALCYQEQFLAGKITYRRFCELDAAHWKGFSEKKLRRIFASIRYSKNAGWVIPRLKAMGFKLAAISTGLQFMTDRVKDELGFDYTLSNRLSTKNGRLTGGVKIYIEHGAKDIILKRIFKRFNVRPAETISIGDSEGDIPLARICGYSMAFNSTSKELSSIVDYNCRTLDFKEVYKRIIAINNE